MSLPALTPAAVMADPDLLRPHFEPLETWATWHALLKAAWAEPLTAAEEAIFHKHAGDRPLPKERVRSLWMLAARRSGKSRIASLLGIHAAVFQTYHVAPGERPVVMVVAADKKQARVIKRYCVGFLENTPALAGLIETETNEGIRLTVGVDIEIVTNSHRTSRGATAAAVICEEQAFWKNADGVDNDREVITALRPALLSTHGIFVALSTLYAKRGETFRAFEESYGQDSDELVVTGDTVSFNPSADARAIERAFEQDPLAAWSEYGRDGIVKFRDDVAAFVPLEVVRACVDVGVFEREHATGTKEEWFVDAASGTGRDAFTIGAATKGRDGIVTLTVLREKRPPFSAQAVAEEYATLIKSRGATACTGDRYSAGIMVEMFAAHGVTLRHSEQDRSALYLSLLPLLTSKRARLLDVKRLVDQLVALERRTGPSGREIVDHPARRGGADDLANAAAGALTLAGQKKTGNLNVVPPDCRKPAHVIREQRDFRRAFGTDRRPRSFGAFSGGDELAPEMSRESYAAYLRRATGEDA